MTRVLYQTPPTFTQIVSQLRTGYDNKPDVTSVSSSEVSSGSRRREWWPLGTRAFVDHPVCVLKTAYWKICACARAAHSYPAFRRCPLCLCRRRPLFAKSDVCNRYYSCGWVRSPLNFRKNEFRTSRSTTHAWNRICILILLSAQNNKLRMCRVQIKCFSRNILIFYVLPVTRTYLLHRCDI